MSLAWRTAPPERTHGVAPGVLPRTSWAVSAARSIHAERRMLYLRSVATISSKRDVSGKRRAATASGSLYQSRSATRDARATDIWVSMSVCTSPCGGGAAWPTCVGSKPGGQDGAWPTCVGIKLGFAVCAVESPAVGFSCPPSCDGGAGSLGGLVVPTSVVSGE